MYPLPDSLMLGLDIQLAERACLTFSLPLLHSDMMTRFETFCRNYHRNS